MSDKPNATVVRILDLIEAALFDSPTDWPSKRARTVYVILWPILAPLRALALAVLTIFIGLPLLCVVRIVEKARKVIDGNCPADREGRA